MTHKQVLTKAIETAISNGWDAWGWPDWAIWGEDTVMFYDKTQEVDHTKMVTRGVEMELSTIFFEHDFARALWGTEFKPYAILWAKLNAKDGLIPYFKPGLSKDDPKQIEWVVENHQLQAWQWHLQRMAVAEDRLKYLEEHLLTPATTAKSRV